MWFIILLINILLIALLYLKIKKDIRENKNDVSVLPEDVKREINSVITEFNKTAYNNINLLEEKIDEIKELLKIAKETAKKTSQPSEIEENIFDISQNRNILTKRHIEPRIAEIPKPKEEAKKLKNKYSKIDSYIKQGYKTIEIAKLLGISVTEVNLYLNLKKSKN